MASKKELQAQIDALNSQILSTINSIKPNEGIQAEGKYATDLLARFRKGEDIAQFMPGYIANIRAQATRNSEYQRSLKGAGNRALGGVDPNLQAQLDQSFGLKSREQDADSSLNALDSAVGGAESNVFAAGQEEDSVNMSRNSALIGELSSRRNMAAEEKARKKSKWSQVLGMLGMGANVAGAFFGIPGIGSLFSGGGGGNAGSALNANFSSGLGSWSTSPTDLSGLSLHI